MYTSHTKKKKISGTYFLFFLIISLMFTTYYFR